MRRELRRALAVLLIGLGSACGGARGSEPPAEWCPLTRELTSQDLGGVRASFTPAISGEYSVTLTFLQPIDDTEIRDLVSRSARGIGIDSDPVQFDFGWRIDGDGKPVASGTGRHGATGSADRTSGGLGGGRLMSSALAFGTFAARAGRVYTIEFQPGAALQPVLRTRPRLEIMLAPSRR